MVLYRIVMRSYWEAWGCTILRSCCNVFDFFGPYNAIQYNHVETNSPLSNIMPYKPGPALDLEPWLGTEPVNQRQGLNVGLGLRQNLSLRLSFGLGLALKRKLNLGQRLRLRFHSRLRVEIDPKPFTYTRTRRHLRAKGFRS